MLVPMRPSNEVLLRARVPGAQDQRGCHSILPACAVLQAGSRQGERSGANHHLFLNSLLTAFYKLSQGSRQPSLH
jgi:hypothetical protein